MKKQKILFLLVGLVLLSACSDKPSQTKHKLSTDEGKPSHQLNKEPGVNRSQKKEKTLDSKEKKLPDNHLELFELDDIKKIKLSYTGFNISLKTTDKAQLTVNLSSHEEANNDEKTTKQMSSMLELNRKNTAKDKKDVTIYLPKSYKGLLLLDLHNSNLDIEDQLSFSNFKLWTDNSNVIVKNLKAEETDLVLTNSNLESDSISSDKLNIEVQKGSIRTSILKGNNVTANISNGNLLAKKVNGKLDLATRRGSIKLGDIEGSAKLVTEQGTIIGNFKKIDDNVELISHRGDIKLFIPKEIGFKLRGVTEKGTIETDFNEQLDIKDGHYQGDIGPKSEIEISAQVNEGGIELKRN
ncbi:DUF4097 family beta strand repeat-containing protein [Vagococcus intermedius]|uniref:DUF4097 domain-containing protein n=1 Tax=Vagococcus intermedius TaxID=2991418 RepID=A0AAF0CT02_9ENTE|nr:DUF4097 family beta strand repeat-containing protein [Vagococcus intermedius]WEG72429.1 DUF4097 domain-containing protein [Vagococcus intermedius]WEG74516.1 DUF4097 domain-containing protein [Vagococcus intermedius]